VINQQKWEKMEHEIAKLRNELKLNSDKFTETTSGASRLRNELSVNTAECLIVDEEMLNSNIN